MASRSRGKGLDEAQIHPFHQAHARYIDGRLPLGVVVRLADHREDLQNLALQQLLGQLAVVRVQHVEDNYQPTVLDLGVVVQTQPLQDLQPLGALLEEASNTSCGRVCGV